MLKHPIEWAARTRFAVPVVLGFAIVAFAVNEATFQHIRRTLVYGIAMTDARLESAKALQAITLMEAAARGTLAGDNPVDRQRFEAATLQFQTARLDFFRLIAQVDDEGQATVARLQQSTERNAALLRTWMDQAALSPPQAGGAAAGSDGFADLHSDFAAALAKAAAAQQVARGSIYDALMFSRLALHALLLLAVVAMLLFVRELRRSDSQRALEHERLASQIKDRTAHLHDLADHLVTAREDERGRLARDLHDEMGGLMTAMKLELARLRRVPSLPAVVQEHLAGIDARLGDGIALKRRIIENLRPSSLDQLGLKVALDMLCADSAKMMGIAVHVDVQDVKLGNDRDLTVFRIVQESLTNIAKYASARTVHVELKRSQTPGDDHVTLTVRDDGRGFDPAKVPSGRHGLLGMQVRVEGHQGSFLVRSQAGLGTQVIATLPVPTPLPA